MCGICGIVAPARPAERETVAAMSELIAHRGPDGDGIFASDGVALGSRRLAILDLSDAGAQPFTSSDGNLHLVYNGEIYNYRELRSELTGRGHRFKSATDTEVIVHAYSEWGERCVERFNGMWAFALWDDREQRLFCARDRFGVKPFYYRFDAGRLVFASELKAFRADPETTLRANERIVRDFVRNDWFDHTDETFFAGIVKLPPAHTLTFDRDGLRTRRYWQLELRDPPGGDPVEAVRELFVDSVRLRLRSDVTVGTCLSGGIDSSAVAGVIDLLLREEAENARPVGERQQTFTVYFDDPALDERPYAREVVARTKAAPHWISFTAEDLVDNVGRIVEAHDEPFRSTSICAGWYVMREAARAGVTVVLDGQGGDEVLAGYPAYFGARYADLLMHGRLLELGSELAEHRRLYGSRRALATLARPFAPASLETRLRERRSGSASLLHPDLRGLPGDAGARRLAVPGPAAALADADPDRARPARAAARRGPQLDGALDRGAGAVPRLPPGRAAVLTRRRAADRAQPDEGGSPPRAARPAAAERARADGQARLRDARSVVLPRCARRPRSGCVRVAELP